MLSRIGRQAQKSARMTFVVGRRRIGKTSLLLRAYEGKPLVYFFVAKKSEALLCEEWLAEVRHSLKVEIFGAHNSFKSLFGYLMDLSKTRSFTLVIDEFQEFSSVNPAVFSEMQNIWDRNKNESKLNLILCGSVYALMRKIFEHSKEPLFGRATGRMHLRAFDISTLKTILNDFNPGYTHDDLLAFYLITGGVAKYVELLVEEEAFTLDAMLDQMLSVDSMFLDEGRNVLIDEFGKEYGNYFSILSLIASSKTSRVEIESIMEMPVGGFLERLETDFNLIKKVRPVFSKPNSRTVKYQIQDNFLNFWFRFIFKYRSAVEMGNLSYVKDIIIRDYTTYSGRILEKYFTQKMMEEGNYSAIGSYWEKGNINEIDIVAVNDRKKSIRFAEVKRKQKHINLKVLQEKAERLTIQYKDYKAEYIGLTLEEM